MKNCVVFLLALLSLCLIVHSFPGQELIENTDSANQDNAQSEDILQNPLVRTAVQEIRGCKPFSSSSVVKYLLVEVHAAACAGFKVINLGNVPPVIDEKLIGQILQLAGEIFGFKASDLSKKYAYHKDTTASTAPLNNPINVRDNEPSSAVATVAPGGKASVLENAAEILQKISQNISKRFIEMARLVFDQCKENAKKIKSEIYSVLFIKSLCSLPDDRSDRIIEQFATQLTMEETCRMVMKMAADPALGFKLGGSAIVTLISKLNNGVITQVMLDVLVPTICFAYSGDYRAMVLRDIKEALPGLGSQVCSVTERALKATGKGIVNASCGVYTWGWGQLVDFVKNKEKPAPTPVAEEVVGKLEASVRSVAETFPQDMKVKHILDAMEILAEAEKSDTIATELPIEEAKSTDSVATWSSKSPISKSNSETKEAPSVTEKEPPSEDGSKTKTMDSFVAKIAVLAITDAPEARRQILAEVTRLVGKEAVLNVIAALYAVDAAPILQTAPLHSFKEIIPVLSCLNVSEMVSIATRVLSVYATAHVSAFPQLVADLPSGALAIMPAVTEKCLTYFATKKDTPQYQKLSTVLDYPPVKAAIQLYNQCVPISVEHSPEALTK